MKKLWLFFFIISGMYNGVYAQSKSIKVLLQQIAALQVYIDVAQKGYSIAQKGLNTVGALKRGELNLHSVYLHSLKTVNPKVKKYVRVAEVIDLQWKIMKEYRRVWSDLQGEDLFYGDELDYIARVFNRLIGDCSNTLDELIEVTTNGEYEMKDDERLKRIDMLYETMSANYNFLQSFKNQLQVLRLSRVREHKDSGTIRALYGL